MSAAIPCDKGMDTLFAIDFKFQLSFAIAALQIRKIKMTNKAPQNLIHKEVVVCKCFLIVTVLLSIVGL